MQEDRARAEYPRGVEAVAGAVIEREDGRILLAQSPKWHDKWILPGGHIEPGETVLAAATREGEEETGLALEGVALFHAGELIGSKDFHRPAHFVFFDAHCRVVGGELALDGQELAMSRWCAPEEALRLKLAESYRETLEAYLAYRKGQ